MLLFEPLSVDDRRMGWECRVGHGVNGPALHRRCDVVAILTEPVQFYKRRELQVGPDNNSVSSLIFSSSSRRETISITCCIRC